MKKALKRFWGWFTLADLEQVQIGGEGSTQIQVGRSCTTQRREGAPVLRTTSNVQLRGDWVQVTVSGKRDNVAELLQLHADDLKEKP